MAPPPGSDQAGLSDPVGIAAEATHRGGGWAASLVSLLALAASGASLWETTFKQADLKLYVSDQISFTRDPWGNHEVLAIPLTIANGGARDAAVVLLELDVKSAGTGRSQRFTSAYTADAQYFGSSEDVAARKRRPKLPFAPISVAGRAAYTGTVLFYPAETSDTKLVDPKSKIELTLRLVVPPPDGWLERTLAGRPEPVRAKAEVPNYLPGALLTGDTVRLTLAP